MATAEIKPSHDFSNSILKSDAIKHVNDASKELMALVKHDETLDLTKLERPEIQNILRRLGVAPKAKEWLLDKGLEKGLRNTLIAQHLISESRHQFFIELNQAFLKKLQAAKDAGTKAALRKEQRAFHAMHQSGRQFSNAMRAQNNRDIEELKAAYAQHVALLSDLQTDHAFLEGIKTDILRISRDIFRDAIMSDALLNDTFKGISDDQRDLFNDIYVERYADHKIVIADHEAILEIEQAKIEQEQDLDKIEACQAKIVAHKQEHADLAVRVARECKLGEHCQILLRNRPQAQERIDAHLSPAIREMIEVKQQLRANLDMQASMKLRIEALERELPLSFTAKPALRDELTEPTFVPRLNNNP